MRMHVLPAVNRSAFPPVSTSQTLMGKCQINMHKERKFVPEKSLKAIAKWKR